MFISSKHIPKKPAYSYHLIFLDLLFWRHFLLVYYSSISIQSVSHKTFVKHHKGLEKLKKQWEKWQAELCRIDWTQEANQTIVTSNVCNASLRILHAWMEGCMTWEMRTKFQAQWLFNKANLRATLRMLNWE